MPAHLSDDPEKRARSLANLRKGPRKAAENFGLEVVDYDQPESPAPPAPAKRPPAKKRSPERAGDPTPAATTSTEGRNSLVLVVGGGLALLALLIVVLNHTPGGTAHV